MDWDPYWLAPAPATMCSIALAGVLLLVPTSRLGILQDVEKYGYKMCDPTGKASAHLDIILRFTRILSGGSCPDSATSLLRYAPHLVYRLRLSIPRRVL